MKIKIKKKVNEISAMGGGTGGNVQGHSSPEELEEIFSTSGAIMGAGSGQGPYERSPEGHERYVRMRHDMQGLKNFKQNRYFVEGEEKTSKVKIKIRKKLGERCQKGYKTHEKRKTKKMFGKTYRNCVKAESMGAPNSELEAAKKAMLGYNIDIDKQIGRGMFGIVYYGISDEIGPVAVKQLERAEGIEEIKRYKEVDLARSKSSYVAKHFPKVHLIQDDATKDPEYVYIVLEILGVEQGYQREVIDMLFRTSGTSIDSNKFSGPTGNKLFVLFNDKNTQSLVYEKFNKFFNNQLSFLKPVFDKYFSYFYDFVQNKKYSKKIADSITDLPISKDFDVEYVMKSGMKLQRASINSVEKLKTRFKDNPWYLAFIAMQLKQLLKKDKKLFEEFHIRILTYWVDFYDKSTVIGTSDKEEDSSMPHARNFYQTSGLPKQQSGLFKESDSLKKAISDLRRFAKLQVRDLKADNTMVRPQTGDIVIVDLGLFKRI
jgi:serine/threonine protein kinase